MSDFNLSEEEEELNCYLTMISKMNRSSPNQFGLKEYDHTKIPTIIQAHSLQAPQKRKTKTCVENSYKLIYSHDPDVPHDKSLNSQLWKCVERTCPVARCKEGSKFLEKGKCKDVGKRL